MKKRQRSNNRITILMFLFIVLCGVILLRLFYLQVIKHEEYTALALGQINREEKINSRRGHILDTNGRKLAINESSTSVIANPSQMVNMSKDDISKELAPLLGQDMETIRSKLEGASSVRLKNNVSKDIAKEIESLNLEGISLETGYKRTYPLGPITSDILGFTNMDGDGQYGIEAYFNEELKGIPGKLYKSSDAKNRQIPTGEKEEYLAEDGMSVVLTIDENIQKIAYDEGQKILEEFDANSSHIIVQEIETGNILAMISTPSYDNNNPKDPISNKQSLAWQDNSVDMEEKWYDNWTNPNISSNYEPGSTFKLITAAAALEENETDPNHQYYCTGYVRDIENGPILKCSSYEDPNGDINMTQAMAKSCNSSFIYMARDLGKEDFLRYIKAFGFGQKTGIELPGEASGIIAEDYKDISDLELATMSYGHGIAVTPIQLISAVSAIANDGILLSPTIVKELVDVDGTKVTDNNSNIKRQVISKKTSVELVDIMETVVEEGTGRLAKSSKYRIAGKTGTASKPSAKGGYEDEYMSSFVGLAPVEDPKISVLVLVDSPQGEIYGSQVAAPHTKNIIERVLEYKEIDYSPGIDLSQEDQVEVPDVEYMTLGEAGTKLTSLGIRYTTDYVEIKDTSIVTKQNPSPGTMVNPGEIVELTTSTNDSGRIIMPNFIGMKLDDVNKILSLLDLDFEYSGKGKVVNQEPEAGRRLGKSDIIKLELSTKLDEESDDDLKDDINQNIEETDLEDSKDSEESQDQTDESNQEKNESS